MNQQNLGMTRQSPGMTQQSPVTTLHNRAIDESSGALILFGAPDRKTRRVPQMALIEVTEVAAERIHELLEKDSKTETHGLRMKVVGGGCSGLRYELAFDDEITERDYDVLRNGIKVIVDEKSALYLVGTTLDFVDTLNESGFKIVNPNAKNTCGCGESFAA